MTSVVFIIRVPHEKDPKTGSDEEKKVAINQQNDYDNQSEDKEVKFGDSDKAYPSNEPTGDNQPNSDTTTSPSCDVEIFSPQNITKVLQDELKSLDVQDDSWTVSKNKQFYHVMFFEKTGERVEKVLASLISVGIGKRQKTSVSIIPMSVHIQPQEHRDIGRKRISKSETPTNEHISENDQTQPLIVERDQKESIKEQFKKSIKSRLTVEQVVESVRVQALLTFDFVMFTILASFIAAVGLVEDNAVVLVASMLVSPLMGPLLGGTFGTVIKNRSLRNTGLKTELCGLALSVVVGFLFGFVCGPFGVNGASWNRAKGIWPTYEMTSRGMTRGLWVGICIALPSGAGVALSVLGGNVGSLVGVAISASLLPPAVNSGILWAYSIISALSPPEVLDNAVNFNSSTSKCPPLKDNSYVPTYSCDMGTEAAIMAIISLVLTIVNIICILVSAAVVLKIKEVSPKASSSNATETFWTKDIKVAREAYQTFRAGTSQATNFLKEWKKVQAKQEWRNSLQENEELLDMIKEVEETEEYQTVVRRAPRGGQNLHKCSRAVKRMVSNEEDHAAVAEAQIVQNQLRNLQTHYTTHSKDDRSQPHVGTIFDEPKTIKKNSSVREFHVVDTENPHHTSVVRVQPPGEESSTYSVKTESGV